MEQVKTYTSKVRPSLKATEMATHELPVLRQSLKNLMDALASIQMEIETVQLDITYYENLLAETTYSFTDGQALEMGISAALKNITPPEVEYLKQETNVSKILFITRHPDFFGKKFFEGGKDIADFIVSLDKKLIGNVSDSLNSSIQSTISRMYIKGQLLKYRFKGTKGKLVALNPDWLAEMLFDHDVSTLLDQIERVPDENDKEEQNLMEAS